MAQEPGLIELYNGEFLMSYCAINRPAGAALSITNITKVGIDWLYE